MYALSTVLNCFTKLTFYHFLCRYVRNAFDFRRLTILLSLNLTTPPLYLKKNTQNSQMG